MDHQQQQLQQQQQQTVYSPIGRQPLAATAGDRRQRRARPRPLDPSTSPKLRYLVDGADDNFEPEEEQEKKEEGNSARKHQEDARARVMFEKCQSRNKSGPQSKKHHHHHQTRENLGGEARRREAAEEEEEEEEERASSSDLEEVYLCSCCGVTRPLSPAMKYMPLFRGSFLLFNLLVFAFGFANLALGLWFRIDPKVYEIHKYIETQNFTYAGWTMLAGGLVACLMALAGFGASSGGAAGRHSICLLISYALTMTLLTVALIGALVLLTVYGLGPPLERKMNKEIYEQIRRRTMSSPESGLLLPNQNDATQFLDFVQVKLRCCGAQDWRDYQKLGLNVPTTCYTFPGNMIDAPGCGRALRELFDLRAGLAAGTTAASVLVQLVATLLASLMVCSIYNYRASPRPASAASYAPPAAGRSRSSTPTSEPRHLEGRPRRPMSPANLGLAV